MSPLPILRRTERLALRRFTVDDAELVVALHGDPEVMHFLDTGRPVARDKLMVDDPAPRPAT